jgi:xanthine dehydrogenase accessory factor
MSEWMARLHSLLSAGTPVVRMAVAGVQGSAPREPGASLLYWRDAGGCLHSQGSVGGGRLEAHSMEIARYLLDPHAGAVTGAAAAVPAGLSTAAPAAVPAALPAAVPAGAGRRRVERFTLGASLGQCCGGVVQMYWERFDDLSQARFLRDTGLWQSGVQQSGVHPHGMRHSGRHHCGIEPPGLLAPGAGGGQGEPLRYCALDGSEREWLLTTDQIASYQLPPPSFAGRAGLLRSGSSMYFVERLTHDATALWLYGAGHVGRALVRVLAELPFDITWIDSRPDMLEQALADLPAPRRNHIAACSDDPDSVCTAAPGDAWHLVMTHCHDQDLRICESLLAGGNFGFLGLIGSRTKAARFRRRLRDKEYAPDRIARLVCPIGIDGIRDKQPAAVAVAVAAQLLQQRALAQRPAAAAPAPALTGNALDD